MTMNEIRRWNNLQSIPQKDKEDKIEVSTVNQEQMAYTKELRGLQQKNWILKEENNNIQQILKYYLCNWFRNRRCKDDRPQKEVWQIVENRTDENTQIKFIKIGIRIYRAELKEQNKQYKKDEA